ncbi:MAG TPA: hypothetical protein ENJ46_06680, partial [Hellea balneolensis]|nr:hypothetical protein [Hellea balneolensis]
MNAVSTIIKILEGDNIEPSPNAAAMCQKIITRHEGRVQALLYYGSSLRAMNDPGKMLDFYVLVDSYRKTHKNPVRAFLNYLIPPAVYYLENKNADGTLSVCKYSILSLSAFQKKTTSKAFLSMIWGRFSQPCVLLFPTSDEVKYQIQNARTQAILHVAKQTAPLFDAPATARQFWSRGFFESYQTEIRPEKSTTRSDEIVSRYQERYDGISQTLFGPADQDGKYNLPHSTRMQKFWCRWKWLWRRILGKPLNAVRILNSAFTFDGGLDYILRKVNNHSGVEINVSPSQKKHPILWSPILAWRLWRRG